MAKNPSQPHMPFYRSAGRWIAAASLGISAIGWPLPAAAYRPFDGTDAAVADLGEVEIEFQPIGAIRAGPTNGLSDAIFNYGFADRWELVLQGTAQPLPDTVGPLSVANAAFLKYVLRPGVLQDKSGPSIATEFGPLLPPPADRASDLAGPRLCRNGGIGGLLTSTSRPT